MKRALCISGGGSKGAFAGGLVNKLYDNGYRWDSFYGTSTGALLNTLIPVYDFETLKNVYTNINNKSIFDKPPFNQRGKINLFRSMWRSITGKKSIGTAGNLLKLIKNTYTQNVHHEILSNDKIVCACVTNFTKGTVEFTYNTDHSYENFVLYSFASASVPIAMDTVRINGDEYFDGGVMENLPLQKAIDDGADEVDVIVLRPNYSEIECYWESKNLFSVILRSIQLMMKKISETDIIISNLKNKLGKNITINLFFIPQDLEGNSLVFDPKVMKKWWDDGYNSNIPEYTEITTKSTGMKINRYKIVL